jgi:hypothetical protein
MKKEAKMKTPEEIKKGLECCCTDENGKIGRHDGCSYIMELGDCLPMLLEDTLDYIQRLEAQVPKWISVHDALPGMDENVLFHPMCNEKAIYIGKLTYVGELNAVYFAVRNGKRKVVYSATHWMPLPELPKKEEK